MAGPKRKTAPKEPEMTDAEIFTLVGRTLFPGDEWPSRFGGALDLSKQTVRDIRRDHANLSPDVAANMLAMVERTITEATRARGALKAWLQRRKPGAGKI